MSKRPRQVSTPKTIFKNKYINLYSIIANFDEGQREYFVSDRGERCGVIIINNQSILLVRQYRYLINDLSWEIPGGGVGEGLRDLQRTRAPDSQTTRSRRHRRRSKEGHREEEELEPHRTASSNCASRNGGRRYLEQLLPTEH